MFFSIITITFNSSQFVRDAIESILASSYTDFELIIGDDCSHDNTWEIINEYNDARIFRYRNDSNLGEYPNRNKALNMARGEWVIYIDGDDVIYPYGLMALYTTLKDRNDIAIAVMCPENENFIAPLKLNSKQIYEMEFSENGLLNRALSHTIYKTSILKEHPFEIDGFIGLDTLNRLQILKTEYCLIIQDNMTWWRRSVNQASKKLYASHRNELLCMSKKLFNDFECPLSLKLQELYVINSKIKLVRKLIALVVKLQFKQALNLFRVNNLSFFDLKYGLYRISKCNPILTIDESIRFSLK